MNQPVSEPTRLPAVPRRSFTQWIAASGLLGCSPSLPELFGKETKPFRVAIVGHTGRGNFGHDLHKMWLNIPGAQIVGVADPDENGRNAASQALNHVQAHKSYRQLFSKQLPDIVAVAMRYVDEHRDVALEAIKAGVRGLYIEKPFCRTPQECDEIIQAAEARQVKVSIAHRNRFHPVLPVVRRLVEEGLIGEVLEYRMRGKEDTRGGALDLWVLGSHCLNLLHYFAGEPLSCSALILQDGKPT
jgi:predicted dehydrogenase